MCIRWIVLYIIQHACILPHKHIREGSVRGTLQHREFQHQDYKPDGKNLDIESNTNIWASCQF